MGLDVTDRIHIEGLSPAHVAMLKQVASEAAKEAVASVLTKMGVDPDKPFEAQKDMQWLRTTRERCEGISGKAVVTVLSLVLAAVAGMLWVGFKAAIGK